MASGPLKAMPDVLTRTIVVSHNGSTDHAEDTETVPSVSGYTPIGIVGWHESSIKAFEWNMYLSDNTIYVGWSTKDGSQITNHYVTVYVLYKRNS